MVIFIVLFKEWVNFQSNFLWKNCLYNYHHWEKKRKSISPEIFQFSINMCVCIYIFILVCLCFYFCIYKCIQYSMKFWRLSRNILKTKYIKVNVFFVAVVLKSIYGFIFGSATNSKMAWGNFTERNFQIYIDIIQKYGKKYIISNIKWCFFEKWMQM